MTRPTENTRLCFLKEAKIILKKQLNNLCRKKPELNSEIWQS